GQEEHRDAVLPQQPEPLDGTRVHGHTLGVDLAELTQHLPDVLGGGTTHGSGDDDDLGAQHLRFDDLLDAPWLTGGDAVTVDISARLPAGGGEGVGIDVIDLAETGLPVDVDQFCTDGDHRHARL